MNGDAMIELRHLQKSFGPQKVLRDVNLEIRRGETMVIIGTSGGGKSVILKHCIGLLQPDGGEVVVDGRVISSKNHIDVKTIRKRMGMLFQGAALFDSMNVGENIKFAVREHEKQHSEADLDKIVAETLHMINLNPDFRFKMPSELSGGMKRRLGLARAIALKPEILLYDEPTTGLDPIMSDSIDQLIIRVRDQLKVTSVVVTHDMRSARRVGNHVFLLHGKKIYAHGTPEDMFSSTDPIVRQFIDGVADAKEMLF